MLRRLAWISLTVFLITNAVFWGLFSHRTHCAVATWLAGDGFACPSHWVHLVMGLVSYVLAVTVSQRNYMFSI